MPKFKAIKVTIERSLVDRVCHTLITWGKKERVLKVAATIPKTSIQSIKYLNYLDHLTAL